MDYSQQDIIQLRKQNLEAEKRFKKVEQDYLHTSQKHTETRSQWLSSHDERKRDVNICNSAADFMNRCNNQVYQLENALKKLPIVETTEETIDHSLMFKNSKRVTQENMVILQQTVQCKELELKEIRDFREFSRMFNYNQRRMQRNDSRKAVNDLLKEVKEKNKCRDKALSNYTLVCNPTTLDNLRKSLELEINALRKLVREIQRDWEEKFHIRQCARDMYKDFKQKVKHLEKKKEQLEGEWEKERKYMVKDEEKAKIGR